ncbi:MAG TPA: hypothetical protein DCY74_04215 [Clostridiales bacterium]|jgi:predicted dehydrogenase|nr:hypothetical protein [Clostridiales bacterium]HBE13358.1 hypothetical protein [Clostridiales bacterium]HCG36198.1 hypothetical protein [Clostridiales bacterium]
MDKIRVGLVGVGRGTAYGKVLYHHPHAMVTALCDTNETVLQENAPGFDLGDYQLFTDYDKFLDSGLFDMVILGTPIPFHEEQVTAALARNIHTLSEVTAADSVEACMHIYESVQKSKAKYMLAENCNYMHFVLEWKKYVDQDCLGQIHYAEGEYVHEIRARVVDTDGHNLWRTKRAPLHYCSHSLGPILYWLDDYIVRGTGSGTSTHSLGNQGIGSIDMQCALFETAKGRTIRLLRSSVSPRKPVWCGYGLYGTKGYIETEAYTTNEFARAKRYFMETDADVVKIETFASAPNATEEMKLGGHGSCEYYLIDEFIRAILEDRKPAIDIVKALDMTIPGLIAHDCAMEGGVWKNMPDFYRP